MEKLFLIKKKKKNVLPNDQYTQVELKKIINRFFIFILWFECILLSFKFNKQCMGQSKITCILLHNYTKQNKNLENVSKEPSNAFVINIKT